MRAGYFVVLAPQGHRPTKGELLLENSWFSEKNGVSQAVESMVGAGRALGAGPGDKDLPALVAEVT